VLNFGLLVIPSLLPNPCACVLPAEMVTFAETAIVNYRLLFADQGKQTSIFRFHVQQTNGSSLFLFSILNQTNKNCRFPLASFSVYIYIEMAACVSQK
jgi:hypothetical protein